MGASVGLPGEHAEVVLFEPVVVESFSGMVVVDEPVGGFGGGPERLLDSRECRAGFGEDSEVFWSVVSAEFVFGGLVESDRHIPIGSAVFDGDVVFRRRGELSRPSVVIPSLMVFGALVLRPGIDQIANIGLSVMYALTIIAGAIGEWNSYILGSAVEVALLGGVVYYAWTWPTLAPSAP
ncbi:MAG TPA: hypothetical protein VIW94_05065 [Acidimicrobiia bacterium]